MKGPIGKCGFFRDPGGWIQVLAPWADAQAMTPFPQHSLDLFLASLIAGVRRTARRIAPTRRAR